MHRYMIGTLAILTFWATGACAAPAPDPLVRSVPVPGGVADADGKIGYVVNDKGGINALDLESGKILWTHDGPARPLVAFDKKLAIQVPVKDKQNQVRIEILDTAAKGKRLRESDAVVFPDWASTGLMHGRSFASSASVQGGTLYLKWEAHASYAGGAPPTEEILKAAKKDADGVAAVSLESGKVELLGKDKEPKVDELKLSDELAKITSQQYFTGSDWVQRPIIVGGTLAALSQENATDGKIKLTLKRWDIATGKAKDSVELITGKELFLIVPGGGTHLFVHQALPKDKLPDGDYAWWIFSLETGKSVGKIAFEQTMELVVVGPRVLYAVNGAGKGLPPGTFEQPRTLKAVDLKSGKALWESPLEPIKTLPPLP